ncbi:MAG TPA: SCO6880 family protein [Cellulomonas sp.]
MSAEQVPAASFAPTPRSGVVLGMSWPQLVLVVVGLVPTLARFMAQDLGGALRTAIGLSVPVCVFAVGRWGGRSLLTRTVTVGVFVVRRLLGQTRMTVDPSAVREQGRIGVPGAAGERLRTLSLVGTRYAGGAFLWDRAARTGTVVLRMTTYGWALISTSEKIARVQAFDEMCKGLAEQAGVARVTTHARTYPATAGEPVQAEVGSWVEAEYADAVRMGESTRPVHRDVLLTVSVDRSAVREEVAQAGGGKVGLSAVLADRVASLLAFLPQCGVRPEDAAWLSESQLRGVVRLGFDPAAADWLWAAGGRLPADAVLASVVEEHSDHLVTDSGLHKTFWVERWPAEPTPAAYLADVVGTGRYVHTVTQMWVPVPRHESDRRLRSARQAHRGIQNLSERIGREMSSDMEAEGAELELRRAELAAGYGDVRYTGLVTISAGDAAELKTAAVKLRQDTPGSTLNPLRGQQYAAFLTSLPLGLGLRR